MSLIGVLVISVALGSGAFGAAEGAVAKRPPKPVHVIGPEHPADLYEQGVSVKVVVRFVVDKEGTVKNPEVISASHEGFIAPTLAALGQWRFEPGLKNGEPADFKVSLPFSFKIPLEVQLKRAMGRDIYVKIDEPIVTTRDLGRMPTPERWLIPPYPEALIESGLTGRAILSFVISKQGLVLNPEVKKSDHDEFALAALLTVCRLRYPVIRGEDGEAIFVQASIEYPFEDPGTAPVVEPE